MATSRVSSESTSTALPLRRVEDGVNFGPDRRAVGGDVVPEAVGVGQGPQQPGATTGAPTGATEWRSLRPLRGRGSLSTCSSTATGTGTVHSGPEGGGYATVVTRAFGHPAVLPDPVGFTWDDTDVLKNYVR